MKRQTARCKACEQCSQHPNGPSKSGGPWQRRLDGRWHRESSLCQDLSARRTSRQGVRTARGRRVVGVALVFFLVSRLGRIVRVCISTGPSSLNDVAGAGEATLSHERALLLVRCCSRSDFCETRAFRGFGTTLPAGSTATSQRTPSTRSARARWPRWRCSSAAPRGSRHRPIPRSPPLARER